jgi:hypothetical protein
VAVSGLVEVDLTVAEPPRSRTGFLVTRSGGATLCDAEAMDAGPTRAGTRPVVVRCVVLVGLVGLVVVGVPAQDLAAVDWFASFFALLPVMFWALMVGLRAVVADPPHGWAWSRELAVWGVCLVTLGAASVPYVVLAHDMTDAVWSPIGWLVAAGLVLMASGVVSWVAGRVSRRRRSLVG